MDLLLDAGDEIEDRARRLEHTAVERGKRCVFCLLWIVC